MTTDETTTQVVPANPFAKSGPDYSGLALGNTAIESERAIAEAQGALTLAKRFPRNQAAAFAQIMETCKRKRFAEASAYAYKRGGKTVTGPSIRLAEELARAWGNIDYGLRELSRGEGYSEMEAYAWDLQTNTRTSTRFTVTHTSLARDQHGLTDARDIYERVANDGSRRLRARILAILPPDLVEAAEEACKQTLAGNVQEPIADRARRMIVAFSKLGVTAEHLQGYLGKPLEQALPDEFVLLQQIFCSLRDGLSKPSEWFGAPQEEDALTQKLGPAVTPPKRGRPPNTAKQPQTPPATVPESQASPEAQKAADVAAEIASLEQSIATMAGEIRQLESDGADPAQIEAKKDLKDRIKKRYLAIKPGDVGF